MAEPEERRSVGQFKSMWEMPLERVVASKTVVPATQTRCSQVLRSSSSLSRTTLPEVVVLALVVVVVIEAEGVGALTVRSTCSSLTGAAVALTAITERWWDLLCFVKLNWGAEPANNDRECIFNIFYYGPQN